MNDLYRGSVSMKFKKEEILKAMKFFSHYDCEIIECLYSAGGKTFKNADHIKQRFKITDAYLENLKSRLLKQMFAIKYEDKIADFDRRKLPDANLDLIYKMSDKFYNMFEDFNPVYVEDKVEELPKFYKEILYLLYGLDGVKCLSIEEVAKVFNISVEEGNKLSKSAIGLLQEMLNDSQYYLTFDEKNLFDKYQKIVKEHGEDSVNSSLFLLPETTKNLIKEYVSSSNLSFKELGITYGMKTIYVHKHIKDGLDKIEEVLSNKSFIDTFFKIYENEPINHIKLAMYELDNKRMNIMVSFLGLNVKRKSISELAKEFNVSEKEIEYIIRTNMLFIGDRAKQISEEHFKKIKNH